MFKLNKFGLSLEFKSNKIKLNQTSSFESLIKIQESFQSSVSRTVNDMKTLKENMKTQQATLDSYGEKSSQMEQQLKQVDTLNESLGILKSQNEKNVKQLVFECIPQFIPSTA